MEEHLVRTVIGPVWTHWGFKYWRLHLHDYAIVAYPCTIWESFKVALRLHMGRYSPDPDMALDARVPAGSYAGARCGAMRHRWSGR